jgi:hypothetical protein
MPTEEGATTMSPILALTPEQAFQEAFEGSGPDPDPREGRRFMAALILPLCVEYFYDAWRPTRGRVF